MTEIASLQMESDARQIREAVATLRELPGAATAAQAGADRFIKSVNEASRSTADFSRRVNRTINDLQFEGEQLKRTAAEQAKYAALRRAGVAEASAEGRAIAASVAALQAQKAAVKASATAANESTVIAKASAKGYSLIREALLPLAAAYGVAELARRAWDAGLKAGNLGEQADQVNLTTEALQAYRFQAAQNGVEVAQLDTSLIRLTATMGQAYKGGKDQIEMFERLGVKLLDANGELRATGDVLPELARGLLKVGSETERNALLTEIFGKSGARVVTMLQDWSKGSDAVTEAARAQGGILEKDVIDAWDKVGDASERAGLAFDVTLAKLGAPIASSALENIERLLKAINGLMDQINSKEGFWSSVLAESRAKGRIGSGPGALRLETPEEALARRREELQKEMQNPNNAGREAMIQADLARMQAGDVAASRFYSEDAAGAASRGPRATPITVGGARNPTPKASGGSSDPYAKAIESAREYILTKNAETAAVGMSADAAARLKHETEMLNKVQGDGKVATAAQKDEIGKLAAAMAAADSALAGAKFMDDAVTKSKEFIATQEIEQQTLFMSAEAAAAYRIEQELLNKAANDNITLTTAQKDQLHGYATAMAAAEARTNFLTDAVGLAKETFTGFFSDLAQGLQQGKSIWESFANAATNALNRIASKLLEMATQKLFESAFGGAGSAGGGLLSGIFNSLQGWFTGGMANAGQPGSPYYGPVVPSAYGNAFHGGNVIPFARGGIVNRPTLFPMANGAGLMGEAGPEAVMPLRRGSNGKLGVEASGGGGGTIVNVYNNADGTKATTRESKGPGGQVKIDVIVEQVETRMAGRMSRGQGALTKTMEGQYGLQRQGR